MSNNLLASLILLPSTWNLILSITSVIQPNFQIQENSATPHFIVEKVFKNKPLDIYPAKNELNLKINGSIFETTFDNLGRLRHFSLIHGCIQNMEVNVLNKLEDLESLAFINNEGNMRITDKVLMKLKNLKELIIHLNNRLIFKENALRHLENLEVLSVDNQTYNRFSSGTFVNCRKLRYLSWSNGFLGGIDSKTFQNLKNILSVILEDLQLKFIEPSTFNNLPLLKLISLARNKIIYISGEEFRLLPNLQTLNLENNLLVSLDATVLFKNVPNLQLLKISNNKLPCKVKLNLQNILKNQSILSLDAREVERCQNIDKIVEIFSA